MIVGDVASNDGEKHSDTIPVGSTDITIPSNGDHVHTAQGGSQPIDTMPPYRAIRYIIRT